MATQEQLQALVARLNAAQESQAAALTGIAADIVAIKDKIPAPGTVITQEQSDELLAGLTAAVEKVEANAAASTALDAEN